MLVRAQQNEAYSEYSKGGSYDHYPFSKHLLNIYYVPGMIPGSVDMSH